MSQTWPGGWKASTANLAPKTACLKNSEGLSREKVVEDNLMMSLHCTCPWRWGGRDSTYSYVGQWQGVASCLKDNPWQLLSCRYTCKLWVWWSATQQSPSPFLHTHTSLYLHLNTMILSIWDQALHIVWHNTPSHFAFLSLGWPGGAKAPLVCTPLGREWCNCLIMTSEVAIDFDDAILCRSCTVI